MARFTTAEAQAIVHVALALFRLEFTIGAKKVCDALSKRSGRSFGRGMGLGNSDIRRCMTAVGGQIVQAPFRRIFGIFFWRRFWISVELGLTVVTRFCSACNFTGLPTQAMSSLSRLGSPL